MRASTKRVEVQSWCFQLRRDETDCNVDTKKDRLVSQPSLSEKHRLIVKQIAHCPARLILVLIHSTYIVRLSPFCVEVRLLTGSFLRLTLSSKPRQGHLPMSIADNLITFTFAATLLTLTPGLDTALILRTATVEGKQQAFRAALGINTGCLLWGAAVAFGLGALIAVSELAFNVLKYCGAAYLAWLGLNMLLRPRKSLSAVEAAANQDHNWFLKGMMGNILNPKIGIFYVSFLPQFIPQGQPLVAWTFGLVSIHVVIGLLWSIILIAVTQPLAGILRREKVVAWMDRVTGVIFVLFAARLAFSKR